MYDFISSYWPFLLLVLLIVLGFVLRGKNTFFYWAARIVAILDIIYLAWEGIELGGDSAMSILRQIAITSLPLLVVLIAAWNNDMVGAVGFTLVGVLFLLIFPWGDFPIGIVPFLIGILFGVEWVRKRKLRKS